jgi:hypothetical protein
MYKNLALIPIAALTAIALFAAACDDDDAEDAVSIKENYDALTATLAATTDIAAADDEAKDVMNDSCSDLQDKIDSDDLDDFCNDLEEAVNDEDQAKFDQVKASFASIEPEIRTAIGEEVGDAVDEAVDDDDDGDDPLEGGDPGDDDSSSDNPDDGLNEDDIENPTDDE